MGNIFESLNRFYSDIFGHSLEKTICTKLEQVCSKAGFSGSLFAQINTYGNNSFKICLLNKNHHENIDDRFVSLFSTIQSEFNKIELSTRMVRISEFPVEVIDETPENYRSSGSVSREYCSKRVEYMSGMEFIVEKSSKCIET